MLLPKEVAKKWYQRLVKPFQVAERISDKNRGVDIGKWISKINTDSQEVTRGVFGKPMSIIPHLITFDCALELLYGAIFGFRNDKQVDCSQSYHNCVMYILLDYERHQMLMSEVPTHLDNSVAVSSFNQLLNLCVFASKQCDSHVFLAISRYLKSLPIAKKSIELRLYQEQYQTMLMYVATEILKQRSLIDAFVGVVLKIVTTEKLPSKQYSTDSPIRDHHDVAEADLLAVDMHRILKEVCHEILLETNFTKMIEKEKTKIGCPQTNEPKFDGQVIMDEVLSRLDEKGFTFSCNYLKAKDVVKSTGTVGVCVLYSCYEKHDDSSMRILDEKTVTVSPRKTGGIGIEVTLPMTESEVDNPFYSPQFANYLSYWYDKIGLWSNAIIGLTEDALKKYLFSSSQGIEGLINQQKTHTSTHSQDMSCLSALISRRWDDYFNGSRFLWKQIMGLGFTIECKEARALALENSERAKTDSKIKDGRKSGEDDDGDDDGDSNDNNNGGGGFSEMKWKRYSKKKSKGKGKVVNQLNEYQRKLELALRRGNEMGKFNYNDKSLRSKWNVVKEHAKLMRGNSNSFMGQVKFNEWYNGLRENELKAEWVETIDHFFEMYGKLEDKSDTTE